MTRCAYAALVRMGVFALLIVPLAACNSLAPRAKPTPTRPAATRRPAAATFPSGMIISVTLAQGVAGDNVNPVNPTTTFAPNAVFHAVVAVQAAPLNTIFRADWYATELGNGYSPDSLLGSTDLTADGTRNLDFTLSPRGSWSPGSYQIKIYVNGDLDQAVDFTVRGTANQTRTPTRPPPKK